MMSCSGMKIQITVNLDAALRRLRLPDQPRLLWVDAICINQGDIIERSRQVRIMRDIYANAKTVVVWLGEAENKDALAFKPLHRLRARLSVQEDSWFLIRLGWYRDKNGKVFLRRGA
jgi:Heterokaryon incompatibility protein (HET)